MCGITGIINLGQNHHPLNELIDGMTEKLRHRGPDDSGFVFFDSNNTTVTAGNQATAEKSWNSNYPYSPKKRIEETTSSQKIALGHRRLSVIDVSAAGHQPMCNAQQDIWMVLNGEIYNYIELRNELKAAGCQFITQSDSEVLLQAYHVWGIDCLAKLNGMWSFVIFDKKKNILFGSRDRTGVKPFYYFRSKDYFAFASEPKALIDLPFISKSINEKAVFDYFLQGKVDCNGETLFSDIQELTPSSYFIFDLNNHTFTEQKYFELSVNKELGHFSDNKFEKYSKDIQQLSLDAVEKRLRSDIPIGFCLSGGIDSSSIVCMAHKLKQEKSVANLGEQLTAFTAVNHVAGSDEAQWAELVTKRLNLKWVKAECTSTDLMNLLPEMVYYQDSPLVSTSTYAQYKVMQSASEHNIPVLIDGQGGDEIFAGYNPFYTSLFLEMITQFEWKKLRNEFAYLSNSSFSKRAFALSCSKIFAEFITPSFTKRYIAKTIRPEVPYFDKHFWKNNASVLPLSGDCSGKRLNSYLAEYFAGYYLKNLLRWEDRCSMRFSIESRTPFADDLQLMNAAFEIPSIYKINNGWNKALFRQAMNGILPDEIRLRSDKMGFSTPQYKWLDECNIQTKSMIADLPDSTNFINKEALLKNWSKIYSGNDIKLKNLTFRYLNFLLWQKAFGV